MAEHQLRDYTIKPGEMEDWINEWRARIVPLRRRHGFGVPAAWRGRADNRFLWLLSYDGPLSFAEADQAYYDSAERRAVDPDPARHIASSAQSMMDPVLTHVAQTDSRPPC